MKTAEIALHLPLDFTFKYSVPEELQEKVEFGKRVEVKFGKRRVIGYIVKVYESTETLKNSIISVVDEEPILTYELLELAGWLRMYYLCSIGEALNCIFPLNLKIPKQSQYAGLSEKPLVSQNPTSYQILSLHHVKSIDRLKVYANEIKKTLNFGDALLIIPEKRYLAETLSFFQGNLDVDICIWHGELKPQEKYKVWMDIKHGKTRVCVGTRSAIFLPFNNLKLIVVEQDIDKIAYKDVRVPRYDLLNVAIQRAKMNNSKLIIGNMFPSLETYYNFKNSIYKIDKSTPEHFPFKKPDVKIVDMSSQYSLFSKDLIEEINHRLFRNEQTVLIFNKKGFAHYVMCIRCGGVLKCQNCEITLVYYINERKLRCHYCNYSSNFLGVCKRCGVSKFRFMSYGLEKVELYLKKHTPYARISTLYGGIDDLHGISRSLRNGDIDILITTSIIDRYMPEIRFSKLGLVGVINLDAIIHFPKYNSTELGFYSFFNTFLDFFSRDDELADNVKLIIQTHTPEHYFIEALKNFNYEQFYTSELDYRERFFYPPFSELILISFSGKKQKKVEEEAESFNRYLSDVVNVSEVKISHPFLGYPYKVKKVYKASVLLKLPKEDVMSVISLIKGYKKLYSTIKMVVDVNPIEL